MNFSRWDIVCIGLSCGVGRGVRASCATPRRLQQIAVPQPTAPERRQLRFLSKVLRFGVNGFHCPRHIESSPVGKTDAEHTNATLSRHPIFRSTEVALVESACGSNVRAKAPCGRRHPALKANAICHPVKRTEHI
jgi:hypothetical protein